MRRCFISSYFTFLLCISELSDINALPTISGDTNLEIFKRYRCKLCDDIVIDNIELVDGELVINEKVVIQICDTFFSKVLHNSFGGLICHTIVKAELDKFLKSFVASGADTRIGEQICKVIHFCE